MFKLICPAQDFSICLRCRVRLSLRQRARPSRQRSTEDCQQLRRFTSGSGASLQQESSSVHDAAPDHDVLGRALIRYSTKELHPNQIYRHESGPPKKDSLGLNVLGEPAEVLILRDKKNRFQLDSAMAKVRASGPDKNPVPEPISSSEMLKKMSAERGILNIEQVCKNIESVRASWMKETKGHITVVAYNELISRLHAGFTRLQLIAYLDKAEKIAGKTKSVDDFDLSVEYSSTFYARSSWQPSGNVPLQKTRAPLIESKALGKGPKQKAQNKSRQGLSKDALVKRILRQCWNIKPELQESPLGELDIRLQQIHLSLILNHKRDILKQISRSYNSKVEAWPQGRIIRVTSDYSNSVDIVKLILHTLENIKLSVIDLDTESMSYQASIPLPGELDVAMIRLIEAHTSTIVKPNPTNHRVLRVFYLGPDDGDLLETRRLMHQILRPAYTQVPKLSWSKVDKRSDASPVPVLVGRRMSILQRNQEWTRWCSRHADDQATIMEEMEEGKKLKKEETEEEKEEEKELSSLLAGPATQAMHGKLAFDTAKSFFGMPDDSSYKSCRNDTPHWTPNIEYHDSVTFGQVLFSAKLARSVEKALRAQKKGIKKRDRLPRPIDIRSVAFKSLRQPRAFVPLVPGLLHSLESLGPLEKSDTLLQIRLSPSSQNLSLPVPVKALPDLEICMSFDEETKTTSIQDVRLVSRNEKDFLQPQNIADLRFIREQCVYAKDDTIDPHISSFVQNSNFSIWNTGLLKTPVGLSLSIPALAIQPHHGFDPTSCDTLLVDYVYLGLEHRSTLTIPYGDPDSWPTLTYTNIEAGRIGGGRDELSLHSLRFASEQALPSTTASDPAIDTESLSEDDHTSILFQKTAALIDTIEQTGQENGDAPYLRMPEARRYRRTKVIKKIRKVDPTGYGLPQVSLRRLAVNRRRRSVPPEAAE